MEFNFFKRIFKRNIDEQNKTSDVATIDTSFIRVPKLSQLSKENKEKVLERFRELNLENYESILKFSDDLIDPINKERIILSKTLERYIDWQQENKNPTNNRTDKERAAYNVNFAILANKEFNTIIANILNIKKELEIRLIALDMFIKKEEKRVYGIRGIFDRAERIRYINHKNRLLSERDRLKTSIKINNSILLTIQNDIEGNEIVKLGYEIMRRSSELFKQNNNEESFESEVRRTFALHITSIINETNYFNLNEQLKEELTAFAVTLIGEDSPFGGKINRIRVNEIIEYGTRFPEHSDWRDLTRYTPSNQMEGLYQMVTNYSHHVEEIAHNRRFEYKKYIEEINSIINKYESTPTNNWNREELEKQIQHYSKETKEYIELCNRHLSDESKNELRDDLFKLIYLFGLLINRDLSNLLEKTYWNTPEDIEYFKNYSIDLANDLLKKVEDKYGIKADTSSHITKWQENRSRRDFVNNNYIDNFIKLYDLLQGNKEALNISLEFKKEDFKGYDFYFNSYRSMSVEDYYYMMKYLGSTYGETLSKLETGKSILVDKEADDTDFAKFVTRIYLKEIQEEDVENKKIVIVPEPVVIGPTFGESKDKKDIKYLDQGEILFLSTYRQLDDIKFYIQHFKKVKTILVTEEAMSEYTPIEKYYDRKFTGVKIGGLFDITYSVYSEEYKAAYQMIHGNNRVKIMTIPNITKYNEIYKQVEELWGVKESKDSTLNLKK